MPANEAVILKEPGGDVTYKASAGVTGKRFLKVSGNRTGGGVAAIGTDLANVYQMAQCGAGQRACGVAAWDVASGSLGKCIRGQKVVTVTSGAAVTAGVEVMSDANGKAIAWVASTEANKILGIAMTGVGATDLDLEVALIAV